MRRRISRRIAGAMLVVSVGALGIMALASPASAARRGSIRTIYGIRYAQPAGMALYLDAYLPVGSGPFPGIIAVHGGGWSGGARDWMAGISKQLAQAGFAAFTIDYRVGPKYLYPAPVDDVRSAITWVKANATSYGVDASHLGALGASSGGTLVMLAALTGSDLGAVVSWSGATDLAALSLSKDPVILKDLTNFVGSVTNETALKAASPITYAWNPSPPTYLAHSTREQIPITQATSMSQALTTAGNLVTLQTVNGNYHGTRLAPWAMSPTIAFFEMHI